MRPASEDELREVVRGAPRVKAAGSGHSFTDIACTDGVLVLLDRMRTVLRVDRDAARVTTQAGITLADLAETLAANGLALENLGDIAYQTVAGAVATGTHGTGLKLGTISTQVESVRIVCADGEVVECSSGENLAAARVSLGALGVVSTVTLRCVPAFALHAREEPMRLEDVLQRVDELASANDHFEFFWFPHTDWCLVKQNNRTDELPVPRPRVRAFVDDVVVGNGVFGLACHLGRVRPSWVPSIARRAVPSALSTSERVDRSDRVFASPRLVRFAEMEYAIPRDAAVEALLRVRRMIEESGLHVGFPVEVRFVAADDALLSPAGGRTSCYIAVHMFRGVPYGRYFHEVEAIMSSYGGRPHWGKLHFKSAAELAPLYTGWERFRAVRARLDPVGRFRNAYLDRVLGPP